MTLQQIIERMRGIRDGIERLAGEPDRQLNEDEARQLDWYTAEFEELRKQKEILEARAARLLEIREISLDDPDSIERGTPSRTEDPLGDDEQRRPRGAHPWDQRAIERAFYAGPERGRRELVARARDAIGQTPGLSETQRDRVRSLLERENLLDDPTIARDFARQLLVQSDPEYMRAFGIALRSFGRTGQPDPRALATMVQRAMSLTDAAGGYLVPLPIDPTLILDDAGSTNPFRRISQIQKVTTDQKRYVQSGAPTWSWDAEAAEVSDDATTFANIDITVHMARGFIPFSMESGEDIPNQTEHVQRLLTRGRDNLEATAFATGSGSGQPVGIVTALSGGSFEIASDTTDVFAVSDVYDLDEELDDEFSENASWVANKKIYQAIREAGGANLDDFWTSLGNGLPSGILGHPRHNASAMDGVINAGADNRVLILGDFGQGYMIIDRVGMSIEFIPHLVGTNHRPTGQRGLFARIRVGADSILDRAFRQLNVT